ncbi:cytochrome P450 71A9-like [Zingiber officinale]|uniref:Cytochrome P450 71A9 n=1 Tax=Zingiber officinale TaxID=94328 RepID=A0A8J5FG91_ZINOF|nr:cytochrome P450 71A9-like [Zingiber officinale]KAG6486100.1 hypothetical protein ZIOFF_054670 [Zingiber officinale]
MMNPNGCILFFCCVVSIPLLFLLLRRSQRGEGRDRQSKAKLPPGPRPLPIIGNLHQLSTNAPHLSLSALAAQHGPLMYLRLGSVPTLVVSCGAAARDVFKHHDLAFSGRPALFAATKLSYGLLDVAFAPHGEYWRQARKVYMVELLSAARVQSFRAVREEEVACAVASIRNHPSSSPVNLSRMMLALANSIVCRTAFGGDGRGSNDIDRILAEAGELMGGFSAGDFFPRLRWLHKLDGLQARLEKVFNQLNDLHNKVIAQHLSREDHDEVDMVDLLLRLHRNPKDKNIIKSMDHVKALLTDIFLAGTNTSSATIIWAMAELMRNPKVMERTQKELRQAVGYKGKVEESDLGNLDYLKLVIKETLRLHPPAPLGISRETTERCTVGSYEVPAGTRVFVNSRAIGRDPDGWSDPEEFWPERFLGGEVDFRGNHDFCFLPFGAGRRICPGINFGVAVVELALANLLYSFDWELPSEVHELDMEETLGITMHKKTPLHLLAKLPV